MRFIWIRKKVTQFGYSVYPYEKFCRMKIEIDNLTEHLIVIFHHLFDKVFVS